MYQLNSRLDLRALTTDELCRIADELPAELKRRGLHTEPEPPIILPGLTVLPNQQALIYGGCRVELTRRECQIVCALAKAHPAHLSRVQLRRAVWGMMHVTFSKTIDSCTVTPLRRKLPGLIASGRCTSGLAQTTTSRSGSPSHGHYWLLLEEDANV